MEKMRVYSGHDTSLISLMAVLNIWNFKKVNYASYLAFELYNDTVGGGQYVKVSKCLLLVRARALYSTWYQWFDMNSL